MKSENRLAAERIMKTPEYWHDRDPDLHEQVHRMLQAEPGGTTPVPKTKPRTTGGKGNPL